MPQPTLRWAALPLLVAALIAGCSNTSEPTPSPTQAVVPTVEETPTPEPSPTATPAPPDVLFDYTSAVGLLNAAEYEQAIARFTMVIRILPEFAGAYHGRALAYYNQELYDFALEDLNAAIELDSKFADAYRNRGIFHLNEGRVTDAVADLQKALEIYRERELTDPAKIEGVERTLRSLGR
ncbi:MAG: hypothetical protein O2854_06155 [Chloroflexi bacterium]|nr:hypothetical protein [Chloroflexota bacterium]